MPGRVPRGVVKTPCRILGNSLRAFLGHCLPESLGTLYQLVVPSCPACRLPGCRIAGLLGCPACVRTSRKTPRESGPLLNAHALIMCAQSWGLGGKTFGALWGDGLAECSGKSSGGCAKSLRGRGGKILRAIVGRLPGSAQGSRASVLGSIPGERFCATASGNACGDRANFLGILAKHGRHFSASASGNGAGPWRM